MPSVESVEEALKLVEERLGGMEPGSGGGLGGAELLLGLGVAGLTAALLLGGLAGATLAALAAPALLAGVDLAVHSAWGPRAGGVAASGPRRVACPPAREAVSGSRNF